MADYGHERTEKEIALIERRLNKEYARAEKEVQEKLDHYMERFKEKDAEKSRAVDKHKLSKRDYKEWRTNQLAIGKRWEEMRDTIAQDYANTNAIARSIAGEHMPSVYAINHNYATFQTEKDSGIDTSYTLYSREAVEHLMRDNPQLLPNPGKKTENRIYNALDVRYNRQQLQSVMFQGIVQGESIPNLAKRLAREVGEKNRKAAVRNARTMATGVQNKGRIDAYSRAQKMGIQLKKCWIATHDGRTRHWHLELDGVCVDNDEPFVNEYGEIMYPGDSGAEPANVYNCRCTLVAQIKGHETDVKAYRKSGDTAEYKAWEAKHKGGEKGNQGKQAASIGGTTNPNGTSGANA